MKAKVAELYAATAAGDERRIHALILPQLIECGFLGPNDALDDPELEEVPTILSWKISEIRYDLDSDVDEICPGQRVRATAGALVFIKQTDQERGQKPETGLLVQPWIYVDGVWYWLIDND